MQTRLQCITVLLGLSCHCASAVAVGAEEAGSPLPKVVKLLRDLKAKLTADGEREAAEFAKYSEWCKKSGYRLTNEIKTGKEEAEDEEATISKASSDITVSDATIEDEAAAMTEDERSLETAETVRQKEKSAFQVSEKELVETVGTLERAMNILQRKMKGAAFVETKGSGKGIKDILRTLDEVVNAASLSLHDQNKLTALVQGSESTEAAEDDMLGDGPSKSVLDLLEDLKQKAEVQLTQLRKEETNARHNFDLMKADLMNQIKLAQNQMNGAKESKSVASQTKASASGDLSVVSKEIGVDKKAYANLNTGCATVSTEYESSVQSRTEEMGAIDKALETLKDVKVAALAAFVQLQGDQDAFAVVNLLRSLAQEQRSATLTQLASRVSSALTAATRRNDVDPFAKVREMISGMLKKLQAEASQEAAHKKYCEKQTADSKEKKHGLRATIDKVTAKSDKAKAKVAETKGHIATLQEELAEIAKCQGEADKNRADEHEVYSAAKIDLQQGLEGIRVAMKILRRYYDKSQAFLQQPTLSGAHVASSAAGGGIIAFLEVIESDLTTQSSRIEVEENTAVDTYKKQTQENAEAKAVKETSLKYRMKEDLSLQKAITELTSDLDGTQAEMDAVVEYSENLRGMCEQNPEAAAAERVARRKAEIAGLQEALKGLQGESLLERDTILLQNHVMKPRRSSLRSIALKP